ncbi:unnamed protein product [Psylliodes chrysocephalus]|uniref:MADF domain-containing protein n=1 Tax=Psylliodes chrysocephalus TaxID=3402493 RepID=A0A9P0CXZ4_9CUCU|nr:unnamed protein product [Psylliodes chrysocephala]
MDFELSSYELEDKESQLSVENSELEHQSAAPSYEEMDHGLLIEAIQGFPYIFDLGNKDYKNNKKKQLAWQQISEVVNCSVEDCIKVWRNLRDRFLKEKKKSSSGAEAPEIVWPYFEKMMFYQKYSKPRKTYTTTKKEGMRPSSQLLGESRPSSSLSVWSSYGQIMSPTEVVEDGETPGLSNRANTPAEAPRRAITTKEAPGASNTPNTPAVGGTPLSAFGNDKKKKRAQDIVGEVGPIVGVANYIMERLSKKSKM